jgi:hypothetical protein
MEIMEQMVTEIVLVGIMPILNPDFATAASTERKKKSRILRRMPPPIAKSGFKESSHAR